MSGWTQHTGRVARLRADNIDTDQLIPARFMSTPRSAGYGRFLLHDVRDRFDLTDGDSIVLAGRNFGCGSSREAAVYALVDFGIRTVIAPSFGDIFASNAVNNGLLPARVEAADLEAVSGEIAVDLQARTLTTDGKVIRFEIDPVWQLKLLNGWDDIDLTAQHQPAITSFAAARPVWSWPAQT
jgi:3-isopropylmalate/(R)-2-methylmalate dehydratase small subunit